MGTVWEAFCVSRREAKSLGFVWGLDYGTWLGLWDSSGNFPFYSDYAMVAVDIDVGFIVGNLDFVLVSDPVRPVVGYSVPVVRVPRSGNYGHLRDREHHPRARAVIGPSGFRYASASLAGDFCGVTRAAISYRCLRGLGGWRYVDD